MRILIVADYFQTKINYARTTVSAQLKKQGHTVAVVTSDRYFPFHNYDETAGKILGKRVQSIGVKKENGIYVHRHKTIFEFFARTLFFGIKDSIEQFKPDLVIVFGISSPSAIQVANLRYSNPLSIPKLVFADSHLPSELMLGNRYIKNVFYFLFRTLFSKRIAATGDRFIALQDATTDVIHHTYGVPRQVNVIPNGTDTRMFYFSSTARMNIRNRYHIPKTNKVVIYTGKLVPSKGIDVLLRALNVLWRKKMNITCLLVGDGPKTYKNEFLEAVLSEHKKDVIITGMVQPRELYKYYSASDVAVWPLQESLAMVDAAACRLPFIANDTLGAKERISNSNALLYKKNDWKDLSKKIEYILNNSLLRRKMGRMGQKLVNEKLQWETIAKEYITV